jgi:hypothetical protein
VVDRLVLLRQLHEDAAGAMNRLVARRTNNRHSIGIKEPLPAKSAVPFILQPNGLVWFGPRGKIGDFKTQSLIGLARKGKDCLI